jgi:hypothetical protein
VQRSVKGMVRVIRRAAPDVMRQAQALLRLLGDPVPQNTEGPVATTAEPSSNFGPACVDQAEPTASTSLTRPEEVSREV